jgi:hypothetical protein
MSSTLRRLADLPNGHLAAKGFCDFKNYHETGLMTEADIISRIIKSTRGTRIPEIEAIAAVRQGIDAAKRKLT